MLLNFQKYYLTAKRKGVDTRDPCMGLKLKKDRPVKNPKENLSKHRQSHLHCFFSLYVLRCTCLPLERFSLYFVYTVSGKLDKRE